MELFLLLEHNVQLLRYLKFISLLKKLKMDSVSRLDTPYLPVSDGY